MNTEEAAVLTTCLRLESEIAATRRPPAWPPWVREDWKALRKYGPRYLPSIWFGDGRPLGEAERVRYLRAVRRLEDAGYLIIATAGGKMRNVKLTPDGAAVAKKLAEKD